MNDILTEYNRWKAILMNVRERYATNILFRYLMSVSGEDSQPSAIFNQEMMYNVLEKIEYDKEQLKFTDDYSLVNVFFDNTDHIYEILKGITEVISTNTLQRAKYNPYLQDQMINAIEDTFIFIKQNFLSAIIAFKNCHKEWEFSPILVNIVRVYDSVVKSIPKERRDYFSSFGAIFQELDKCDKMIYAMLYNYELYNIYGEKQYGIKTKTTYVASFNDESEFKKNRVFYVVSSEESREENGEIKNVVTGNLLQMSPYVEGEDVISVYERGHTVLSVSDIQVEYTCTLFIFIGEIY